MKLLTILMTAGAALETSTTTFTSASSSDSHLATSTLASPSKSYPLCMSVEDCDFHDCKQPDCKMWTHDFILHGIASGMFFQEVSENKVLFKYSATQ